MPPVIDALLQAEAAIQDATVGQCEEAQRCAAGAVEEMPGEGQLIALESQVHEGLESKLDAQALLLSTEPSTDTKAGG